MRLTRPSDSAPQQRDALGQLCRRPSQTTKERTPLAGKTPPRPDVPPRGPLALEAPAAAQSTLQALNTCNTELTSVIRVLLDAPATVSVQVGGLTITATRS